MQIYRYNIVLTRPPGNKRKVTIERSDNSEQRTTGTVLKCAVNRRPYTNAFKRLNKGPDPRYSKASIGNVVTIEFPLNGTQDSVYTITLNDT